MKSVILASCLLLTGFGVESIASPPPVPYPVTLDAGTDAEQGGLLKNNGTTIVNGARIADIGQWWAYWFTVNPGESCLLTLITDAALAPNAAADANKVLPALPTISASGPDGKPIPVRVTRAPNGAAQAAWTVPDSFAPGTRVSVAISAKTEPVRVTRAVFSVRLPDKDGTGIPPAIQQLLLQGAPAGTKVTALPGRQPDRPYTALQTPSAPQQNVEVPVDAVFAYTTSADAIQGWKTRGYTVWTMGGSRSDKAYVDQHKDEMQVREDGTPRVIEGTSYYLTPSANRNSIERAYYDAALTAGSEGVCPEEPEFFADAGYSEAFKRAWKEKYRTDWQSPSSSIDAAYRSAQLMASMETEHVSSVLKAADGKPGVRRMVALHSPINYAMWSIVAPQYAITSLPQVQDVVGQVWTGTARSAVRYAGIRADRTFSLAYLEYSSLYHLTRGTGKRMWFLMDPLEDDPSRAQADYKSHYEQTLIAALLFPEIDSYEVMPWPDRIFGHIPAEYSTEIGSAVQALQLMHEQKGVEGSPATAANIGTFVSDSMQYQRSKALHSDFDGVFGLTLPLLERGVPVQAVSLDRAADPGYLKPFKTLLYSADYQKPTDARTHAALVDWVKRGGTLIVMGGSDPGNALTDAWWTKAGFKSPLDDLWQKLGITAGAPAKTVRAPEDDGAGYEAVAKTDGSVHDMKNRNRVTVDLTRFCADTGSVAIRFTDATPQDGWGPYVTATELRVNGQLAASFASGSDLESRFMVSDHGSEFNGEARYADRGSSFTYQFDNIPVRASVQLTVDIANGYVISASPAEPIFGHTLISTSSSTSLKKAFPRLRIGADYPATVYPGVPTTPPAPAAPGAARKQPAGPPNPLYTLRSGGTAAWMQKSGDGLVIYAGVAPGFFTSSSRSAGLLRALVQYGHQRAGGQYREPGSLRLRRGRFTIIHTFQGKEQVEGRTIDVLSPTLNVAEDRVIPPNSQALLYDIGDSDDPPHIGFVSGRVEAKVEAALSTAFFVRGTLATTGAARLHAGGHGVAGVKAFDRLGRPLEVQVTTEGETVLLRYPNDPDGVVIRVGWKQ